MIKAKIWAVLFVCAAAVSARAAVTPGSPDFLFLKDVGRIPSFTDTMCYAELTHEEAYRLVAARLAGSGVPESFVAAAFADPRVVIVPKIVDRWKKPAETRPHREYHNYFLTQPIILAGARFYEKQKLLLDSVRVRLGVDPFILVGLVGVETSYGRSGGDYPVFEALYTTIRKVPEHSTWAMRELAEFIKLCYAQNVGTQYLNGSYAGAFGYFQFEPSSFNEYAIDFDGDGRRRWDEWPDVFGSMANYLDRNGYEPGGAVVPGSRTWKSLYAYNHSDNYVRTVTELSQAIEACVTSGRCDPPLPPNDP